VPHNAGLEHHLVIEAIARIWVGSSRVTQDRPRCRDACGSDDLTRFRYKRLLPDVGENRTHGVVNLENWSDSERHVLGVQKDVRVG
jgi:hypothetical protein